MKAEHWHLGDLWLALVIIASVLTCGWALNCNDEREAVRDVFEGGETDAAPTGQGETGK